MIILRKVFIQNLLAAAALSGLSGCASTPQGQAVREQATASGEAIGVAVRSVVAIPVVAVRGTLEIVKDKIPDGAGVGSFFSGVSDYSAGIFKSRRPQPPQQYYDEATEQYYDYVPEAQNSNSAGVVVPR